MIRFTANFSRWNVQEGLPIEIVPHRDWLISIADCDTPPVEPHDNFGKVLFLHFDDTDNENDPNAIVEWQVKTIAAFINHARENNKNVWVNCHAGICRSGAIVELLGQLGWMIADEFSPERHPNRLVKELVRQKFVELKYSWE